ncbi:hypothetical protein Nepgr_006431 [Nepenthes gracilis]|uniref:Uncharacterized protein n=1 Tax=Nepenthes gracilis TaxID=150966 RepID=A0AAD3XHL1_NEPGR|nr:hypothetical protein Nepgr_006431 [Nepenthes gracilis]
MRPPPLICQRIAPATTIGTAVPIYSSPQLTLPHIQIRVLLEKTANMELEARAGENVKKELQLAHKEAQSLVVARQELTAQIEQATQELEKAHTNIKKLPNILSELDSLR